MFVSADHIASRLPITLPEGPITAFCRAHHVRELALFGSVLREDFSAQSDVDVLVDLDPAGEHTLFDLVDMQDELSAIFQRKVDVVTKAGVSRSRIAREILSTCRVVYAQ